MLTRLVLRRYIQWAPAAYIIKLYLELIMANMISKVVRSPGPGQGAYFGSGSDPKSNPATYMTSRVVIEGGNRTMDKGGSRIGRRRDDIEDHRGSSRRRTLSWLLIPRGRVS